jgi:Ca2+-binding RTX toxin-like protein
MKPRCYLNKFEEKKDTLHLGACLFLLATILFSPLIVTSALAAVINGNDFDNSLYGTMADDTIRGKGGSDNLFGIPGNDDIGGGSGNDFVQGDSGNDNLKGDDGNDYVQGGSGIDTVDGGSGNDTLISSFITGSTTVRDFQPDNIICGDGLDTAFINLADNDTVSSDCEIIVSTPAAPNGNQTLQAQSSIQVSNQTQIFPIP